MNPKQLPPKKGPEYYIREDIIKYLTDRGWYVKITHGSLYQSGVPDLYATHKRFGPRWIEVKLPNMQGSRFTNPQKEVFVKFEENGSPVWIMTAATDAEYKKLFEPSNFMLYFMLKGW